MRSARKRQCTGKAIFQVLYVAALVLSGPFFYGDAVHAATLTNRDDKEHKLTIIEGDTTVDHLLKPQQVLEKICAKGCVVRLNDSEDDEYQLDPEDAVSVEDGYLYHDAPAAPGDSGAAPAGAPPAASPPPLKQ